MPHPVFLLPNPLHQPFAPTLFANPLRTITSSSSSPVGGASAAASFLVPEYALAYPLRTSMSSSSSPVGGASEAATTTTDVTTPTTTTDVTTPSTTTDVATTTDDSSGQWVRWLRIKHFFEAMEAYTDGRISPQAATEAASNIHLWPIYKGDLWFGFIDGAAKRAHAAGHQSLLSALSRAQFRREDEATTTTDVTTATTNESSPAASPAASAGAQTNTPTLDACAATIKNGGPLDTCTELSVFYAMELALTNRNATLQPLIEALDAYMDGRISPQAATVAAHGIRLRWNALHKDQDCFGPLVRAAQRAHAEKHQPLLRALLSALGFILPRLSTPLVASSDKANELATLLVNVCAADTSASPIKSDEIQLLWALVGARRREEPGIFFFLNRDL